MKNQITKQEAVNEKRLLSDLKKLMVSVSSLRKQRYMNSLPYYQLKLEDIQADCEQLLQDAKEGFATANRN